MIHVHCILQKWLACCGLCVCQQLIDCKVIILYKWSWILLNYVLTQEVKTVHVLVWTDSWKWRHESWRFHARCDTESSCRQWRSSQAPGSDTVNIISKCLSAQDMYDFIDKSFNQVTAFVTFKLCFCNRYLTSNTLAPALTPRTTWPNKIDMCPKDLQCKRSLHIIYTAKKRVTPHSVDVQRNL